MSVLIFLSLILSGCDWMIYISSPAIEHNPIDYGVTPQEVWFKNDSNDSLHGWYFRRTDLPQSEAKAVFLYFHGNGGNVTTHFPHLVWLLSHGYDFFIFDYRGFGKSLGTPSPEHTVEDGKAALRYLLSQSPRVPWVVFAQSLGSVIGLKTMIDLRGEIQPTLIIVDSGFDSYRKIGEWLIDKYSLPKFFNFFLPTDEFAPGQDIKMLSPSPLLVIHGDRDSLVDYSFGVDLYNLGAEPKQFWQIPGGEHTDVFLRNDDKYRASLLKLLSTLGI
ncbi:MAG: alpha/beta fold hydrolase [Bdellovibrionota bacterium]